MARRSWTRRETLQGAAAVAATACARSTPKGDTGPTPGAVDTVVFIMMENRSFDHWFGARTLLEGKDEQGLSATMSNTTPDGVVVAPFASADPCLIDPPHSWSASHAQWNEGRNDGFCTQYAASSGTDGAGIMAYQTREDVPISWALADAYTHCDQYFCALLGPTWPNRIYAHAGSSQGMTSNAVPAAGELYTIPTIWTVADAAGIRSTYYYSDVPFIALFQNGYNTERAKIIDDFFTDAEQGTLPPIVWLDPAFSYNDNHPPKYPGLGELFLASVYEALVASPQWERMLVIVTYDEHGGFFDHVAPPTTPDDGEALGFGQLGFRVPCILMGPWVKQGVQSTVFNHGSWLKLVCELNGLTPWTQRISGSNSLAEVLDTDRMATGVPLQAAALPAFSVDEATLGEECAGENDVTSTALQRFAEFAASRGYPVRLDPRAVAAPFLAQQTRRGLIG